MLEGNSGIFPGEIQKKRLEIEREGPHSGVTPEKKLSNGKISKTNRCFREAPTNRREMKGKRVWLDGPERRKPGPPFGRTRKT